ncbi:MAG: hypothetical protein J6I40_00475, partial [Mailhella sp.]|nr:hypothetical protein [Mailhella sp.]
MNTFDLKAFVTALKDHPELLLRLQGVPDSLCMEAIAHGSSLEHIPLANRTRELCLAAVRRIGRNLDFVPEDMKDNQFYSDALAGTSGDYELFDRLPDSMKTRELCEKAVIEWGSSIKDVPERVRDKEFYAAVIAKGRFKLDEVPPEFLTEDDVLSCLKGTDTAYGFSSLPDRLKTQATCLAAAQKFWGFDLSDVPDHLRTPEIFALSIINDNCDVPIPEDMPFPWRLSDKGGVPDAPKSMIAFYNAMLDDPTLLWRVKGVPEQQLIEALWEHDESLRFVPVSLRTPEFARKIMNVYPAMYDRLPKYMQTAELQAYVEALEKKHNGVTRTWINLRELPEEQRTPELCMKAV